MNKKAKRVLIICKGHQNIAGAQLYLKHISTVFKSEDYELHFALRRKDGLRVFEEIAQQCRVRLWEYDWRHLSARDSLVKGMRLIRKISPDMVIFNSSEDQIIWSIWCAWLCRVPKRVMIVHWAQSPNSLPLFRRKGRFRLPVPSRYSIKMRSFRGLSFHLLNKIVFVNNITRHAYIHLYKIPRSRCVTIYNGVPLESFSNLESQRKNPREVLGVKSHECMVLATGNLAEVKGYKYLISSIHELSKKNIPLKCFIAGQGELKNDLESLILKLGLEIYVKILGYRNDIPALLSAADIFCMPSLNEALGYSLLEAMAAGIPVVASAVGGIPEVISHGKEGLLVRPGDAYGLSQAIEKLARDAQLRQKMGISGRKTARERFSLKTMLSKTENFFKMN